jgi:tRNA (mo5U34)-methyltransferase
MKTLEEISWWHRVPLPDGRVTPGKASVYQTHGAYLFDHIPFKGKTVLDVGCWDGYFSFMAEKRGASRVVGMDDCKRFHADGMAGFWFLHDQFKSRVEFRDGNLFDPPSEKFDIVLCYGVLYHLNDPLVGATNCFQMANELVCFEGLIFKEDRPILSLLRPGELNKDTSNFYRISTGYLTCVGDINGFVLEREAVSPTCRGSMLFRRVKPASATHALESFSHPPRLITRS